MFLCKFNMIESKYTQFKLVLHQYKNPRCLVCFTLNNSTCKMNGGIWLTSYLLWCHIGTMYANINYSLWDILLIIKIFNCRPYKFCKLMTGCVNTRRQLFCWSIAQVKLFIGPIYKRISSTPIGSNKLIAVVLNQGR